jgi:tRNA threonylcarbamoyladenosine biosynthesis protein TsaB
MSLILCIETATPICSIALVNSEKVIGYKETRVKNSHAEVITVFIDELLKEHSFNYKELQAIAISKGPGSYTGLRIGVSTTKGLCYALNIPLIAVSTLRTMAVGALVKFSPTGDLPVFYCPMIDARRMEVYSALFDANLNLVREIKAEIIEEASFAEILETANVVFFGDGSEKCKAVIQHSHAIFLDDIFPSAPNMALIVHEAFKNEQFEDVAYFEPYYLKDFIPGIPKVKGLQ